MVLQLATSKIMPVDVVQLKFFTEFVWLVDYTFFVLFVYLLTEVKKPTFLMITYILTKFFSCRFTMDFTQKHHRK